MLESQFLIEYNCKLTKIRSSQMVADLIFISNDFVVKSRRSHHFQKKAFINKRKGEMRLEQQQKKVANNSPTVFKEEIELLKRELAENEDN